MDRRGTTPPRQPLFDDADAAGIRRAYRRVVIVWLVVLAGLWWLQQAFL